MQILKSISGLVLALLVTLSSMGFYVDQMICGMTGERTVAINKQVDACSDECENTETESISASCCDFDSFYFQEDIPTTSTESKTKNFASIFKYIPLTEIFTGLNCAESGCFHPLEAPDILPTVERYILLQTFLI